MEKVKMLAKAITSALNASGCNILNNCGELAGQSVMHFHVHIIPRYENDDLKIEFKEHSLNLEEIQKIIVNKL